MNTIVKENKKEVLAANYKAAKEIYGTDESFKEYVTGSADSDPNFFRWLFDCPEGGEYGNRGKLSEDVYEAQNDAWNDYLDEIS